MSSEEIGENALESVRFSGSGETLWCPQAIPDCLLHQLIQYCPVGLAVHGPDGKLELTNPAYRELTSPRADCEASVSPPDVVIHTFPLHRPDGSESSLEFHLKNTARPFDAGLESVADATYGLTDIDFFRELVRRLAVALKMKFAFVAECTNAEKTVVRTLAFWTGEGFGADIEYALEGHPCEGVVSGATIYYADNVCLAFPRDVGLRHMGARSYFGVPLRDTRGEIIGHLAGLHDESKELDANCFSILKNLAARAGSELSRMRSERALLESERHYRSLVEGAAYGMCQLTRDGQIVSVNQALVEMLGFSTREELLAMNLNRMLERPGKLKLRYEGDRLRPVEVPLRRADGETIVVRAAGRARPDEQGKPKHFELIVEDVTVSRRLEEQLQQSQRLEAIGRMAGGIAHDFNNVLMAIVSYVALAEIKMPEDDGLKAYLAGITKAADQAGDLVRQLLAFASKQAQELQVISLRRIVENNTPLLARLLGDDIELVTHFDCEGCVLRCDPTQVGQVLVNLALNARDAMPKGGKLTLETCAVSIDDTLTIGYADLPPGEFVMIAVSDTGIGMSEETKSRIFEPFFTTKEKGKGTGLGLATVYGLVKQAGGHVHVYSDIGKGSTFKVYLPRELRDRDEAAIPAGDVGEAGPPEVPQGTKVLLVDDEEMVLETCKALVESLGYDVVAISSPDAALAVASTTERPIDVLMTDVMMPGMDGIDLSKLVRKLHPAVKVLLMSGFTEKALETEHLASSDHAFLSKPFRRLDLAQCLAALQDGGPADPGLSAPPGGSGRFPAQSSHRSGRAGLPASGSLGHEFAARGLSV